jgi:hypothetical protein
MRYDYLKPFTLLRYPCQIQGTKSCLKLVIEASQHIQGQENRHGFILATVNSRNKMPAFESNKDYSFFFLIYKYSEMLAKVLNMR